MVTSKCEDLKEPGLGLCNAVDLKGAGDAPLVLLFLPEVIGKTNTVIEFEQEYERC